MDLMSHRDTEKESKSVLLAFPLISVWDFLFDSVTLWLTFVFKVSLAPVKADAAPESSVLVAS